MIDNTGIIDNQRAFDIASAHMARQFIALEHARGKPAEETRGQRHAQQSRFAGAGGKITAVQALQVFPLQQVLPAQRFQKQRKQAVAQQANLRAPL